MAPNSSMYIWRLLRNSQKQAKMLQLIKSYNNFKMAHRRIGQKTFADQIVQSIVSASTVLQKLDEAIDWAPIKAALSGIYVSPFGKESYPPLAMFKILLLQNWYNLSDSQAEDALRDRISFRYFCGFSFHDETPDKTTLCTFRKELVKANIDFLALINQQIEQKGLIVKTGTLIDATVIEADASRPKGGEQSTTDPQAGWTKKRGQYVYGYKAHIGVDEGTEFVRKAVITSADYHDSQIFYQCISGDERSVYADKAYDVQGYRLELRGNCINDRMLYKAKRNHPINLIKKWLNATYSKKRAAVERIFGTWKRSRGYRRARYRGWEKNQMHLTMVAVAHNLKRIVHCRVVSV